MTGFLEKLSYGDKPVRIQVTDQGQPWFCLADVAAVLDIKSGRDFARSEHCHPDGVENFHVIDDMGRNQEALFINEPNLYALIFRSSKPSAKAFRQWVFEEVLPQIRKTGAFRQSAVVDGRYAPPTPVPSPNRAPERHDPDRAEFMDGAGASLDPTLALLEVIKQQYLKTAEHDRRLSVLEERQSAAADALSALPAPTEEAPDLTDADRCRQMVEKIASLSGKGFRDVWHDAYREYDLRLRVCVQKRVDGFNKGRRPKDQITKLEWVVRFGSIGALYSILCQMRDKLSAALAG